MDEQDYTTTITVERPPKEVFHAISNARGWWSETIIGDTTALGDEFVQHVPDLHWARLQVSELEPGRTVAWQVLDSLFPWTADPAEWRGTQIRFDLTETTTDTGIGTTIRFTHVGLLQDHECFDRCANAWGGYIYGSLKNYITAGTGNPNKDDIADTMSTAG